MSLAETVVAVQSPDDHLRESWRQVFSMKRSTQQFRARLARMLPVIEKDVELDPQFEDVTSTVATMLRILEWSTRDLDRLRLPDELFEVVPVQPTVRVVTGRKTT